MAEVKLSGEDGLVYYDAEDSIEGASHTTGTVTITLTDHDFVAGERIAISAVVGMTDLNDHFTIIAVVAATSIDVTLTTAQSYTSGGKVRRIVEVTLWDITAEAELIEVTDSGSTGGDKEFIESGYIAFSGSIEGLIYTSLVLPVKGALFTFKLSIDATRWFTGSFLLTSESDTLAVVDPEAIKITFAFQGLGTLTPVNAGV